ncbi:putative plant organelle RNA recognition domain-containing protein [Helianthus annuus]|nr:putative plant organelle RNA recognition domain-containing protein [Helianthus annuus]
MMKIPSGKILINTYVQNTNFHLLRRFSLWSMKKDPDLEAALTRNRRWIVNNQIKNIGKGSNKNKINVRNVRIEGKSKKWRCHFGNYEQLPNYSGRELNSKNIILMCPDHVASVNFLQRKFKTLDLQGKALNWVKKYPNRKRYARNSFCSEKFHEFDSLPYISPYTDPGHLVIGSKESEKRTIGLLHEFLSLTLWKKASIMKLGHFTREFHLPERLNVLLLKHPGIFYVSNKYQIYTVLLRAGYNGLKKTRL